MDSEDNYSTPSLWLRMVRYYTFNFPINKGKGRAFRLAKRLCHTLPVSVLAFTKDGRRIVVGFRDWADDHIYFLGSYEPFCTEVVSRYIVPGRICFDVGANIGWYTTLFQKLCGSQGEVHSFEPVPSTFHELCRNVRINHCKSNVYLNQFSLGDYTGEVEMSLIPDEPSGHASMYRDGNLNAEVVKTRIKTLNSYLREMHIHQVDFVKVDIEGAELMFLKGATLLFEQKTPPVILMEMSWEISGRFGHQPDDLIRFISRHAAYNFFALDEKGKKLRPFCRFEAEREGCNVLCLPQGYPEPESYADHSKCT